MTQEQHDATPQKEIVNREYQRKYIFSYFLPFGVLSRPALNTAHPHTDVYATVYQPTSTCADRARKCLSRWEVNTNQINVIERSGYIEEKTFSTGQPNKRTHYFALTRPTINLLAGIIDWDAEEERKAKIRSQRQQGRVVNYTASRETEKVLAYLSVLKEEKGRSSDAWEEYERAMCEAVCCWDVTMLGVDPDLTANLSLAGHYNNDQRSRACKLANVITMFRQNEYLTFLDRRPLDTNWEISNIQNEEDFQQRLRERKVDIPALTAHCLRKWYQTYPDSYLFSDPGRLLSENMEQWKTTPVFYSLNEIPGYNKSAESTGAKGSAAKEKKNTLRSTAIGVGIGAYVNYIIYHISQNKFRWNIGIEKAATKNICETMQTANKNKTIPGFERTTENAIMFFEKTNQFDALFADLLKVNNKYHRPGHIPMPFVRMFLIPINTSGLQQLRMLMEYTPYEFIQTTVREICEIENEYAKSQGISPRIFPTNDLDYPLAYNQQPVLFAYDMEVRKLRQAVISYQLGKKFYVACYPEQVKFIQRIMPDAEFI